jgi:hypothetical protein
VLAAAVVECEVVPDGPPAGDDPVDEDDTPGPSTSEDDHPGPAIEAVPEDELTDQSDEPEPTRPAEATRPGAIGGRRDELVPAPSS